MAVPRANAATVSNQQITTKPRPRADPNSRTTRQIMSRTTERLAPAAKAIRDKYVDFLLKGHTKAQAAIYAGYAPRSAFKKGSELYYEPYVQERLAKLRDKMDDDQIITRKEVIIGLVQEARNDGPDSKHAARVQAWSQVAKIMGYEAPTKVEATVTHKGGIMVVALAPTDNDWEAVATVSQNRLQHDAVANG